jgi:hypothetical protein
LGSVGFMRMDALGGYRRVLDRQLTRLLYCRMDQI